MAEPNNPGKGSGKKEINPEAKEHWMRGNSLFDESKFDEAIKEYGEAIKVDKEYASAYFNRALNHTILKNFDAAKKDLQSSWSWSRRARTRRCSWGTSLSRRTTC